VDALDAVNGSAKEVSFWPGALIRLSKVVARAGTDAPIISPTAANEAADKRSLEAMYMPPQKCHEL
jgi:hypothetical protein